MFNCLKHVFCFFFFFFQAEDGIRDYKVTGVQTCALPATWRTRSTTQRGLPSEVMKKRTPSSNATSTQRFMRSRYSCDDCSMSTIMPIGLSERRRIDRKSTRLNSSHLVISYAVFCLKK